MVSINDWAAKAAVHIAEEHGGPYAGDTVDVDMCAAIIRVEVERWLIENIDSSDVPNDEGNSDALCFNLVHLFRYGKSYKRYCYEPEQDNEIAGWGRG